MRLFHLLLLVGCLLVQSHAEDGCVLRAGEVVSWRDPRLRDPTCVIEAGVVFRVQVEEVTAKVTRARLERRRSCLPAPDESALMDELSGRALTYLRERGVQDGAVEVVDLECAETRNVDVVIVEVR